MKQLYVNEKQKVEYCIPTWLRDEQIKLATARIKERLKPGPLRDEPIALVCFGPSLRDTWEQVKDFKYIMSCSGAHKFLLERGIVPTWHVEVDPRSHKVHLIGQPHPGVEYLISATCHPAVFDHLEGYKVTLWHVFANEKESIRTMPANEWAITGGCSVGLRTMTIARFLGFTNQHIFGMDGCHGATGSHAEVHPTQFAQQTCEYGGKTYITTISYLEAAKQTWHELDQMPDVKPTFYGEGLVQAMAKDYIPKPVATGKAIIAYSKPSLISAEYIELNRRLHRDNLAYGIGGTRHVEVVKQLKTRTGAESILDYGCGKSYLAKHLPFPIWEYDPAIPGKEESPKPADLVICTSVLEHVEPDKLPMVLNDIQRCVKKIGYFTIGIGPAQKILADGRNAHLIQQKPDWWNKALSSFFNVAKLIPNGPALTVVVGKR